MAPSNVLERTLHEISATVERSLFAEEISARTGLLQSLDPRLKLVAVLALLIGVGLSRSLWVIGGVYLFALLLAWRSKIPMDFYVKRVWLLLPFFTGLLVLPAFFVVPGPALVTFPGGLTITQTGAVSGLFLLLRVSTSVSLTLLLVLTTPWNTVLNALTVLHVPDVFVLILGMTYRYIYLLLRAANDMFLSRQSRVVGKLNTADQRRILAATAGTLFNRSLDLSSEVYLAMQSRGFRGYARSLQPYKMQTRDWTWAAIFSVMTLAVILLGG
jgi:cobalt ECF transporter T component CbiQ